jgi:hypothetical protein
LVSSICRTIPSRYTLQSSYCWGIYFLPCMRHFSSSFFLASCILYTVEMVIFSWTLLYLSKCIRVWFYCFFYERNVCYWSRLYIYSLLLLLQSI